MQLEASALRRLKARGALPPWPLRWLVTNAVMIWAAHFFFFPPLEVRTDTAVRVAAAIRANADAVVSAARAAGWLRAA